MILTTLEPGGGTGDEAYTHESDEEVVIVLEGSLDLWVGDEHHVLADGDFDHLLVPSAAPQPQSRSRSGGHPVLRDAAQLLTATTSGPPACRLGHRAGGRGHRSHGPPCTSSSSPAAAGPGVAPQPARASEALPSARRRRSLLQHTVRRIPPLVDETDIFCVADRRYGQLVRDQVPDVGLIVEPSGGTRRRRSRSPRP